MIQRLSEILHVDPNSVIKLGVSLVVLLSLWLVKRLTLAAVRRKVTDVTRAYRLRRSIGYTHAVLVLLAIGIIWIEGARSVGTFLGLVSAGLAIAMHDTIANIAGWVFIIGRKPFKVGDRIQIGDTSGDVIDIRVFQFSMVEIGRWVDADQSTGRIIHVPNSKVLRENLANFQTGFDYIWHEIPVLVTFESNWKEAKSILQQIAANEAEHLSEGAENEIRRAAMRYLIFFNTLTPIVYTTVKPSGVLLTIRYIVAPRKRRESEAGIWEAILDAFAERADIDLAYPTTRFYRHEPEPDEACSTGSVHETTVP